MQKVLFKIWSKTKCQYSRPLKSSKGALPESTLVKGIHLVIGCHQETLLVPAPRPIHSLRLEVHHAQANLQGNYFKISTQDLHNPNSNIKLTTVQENPFQIKSIFMQQGTVRLRSDSMKRHFSRYQLSRRMASALEPSFMASPSSSSCSSPCDPTPKNSLGPSRFRDMHEDLTSHRHHPHARLLAPYQRPPPFPFSPPSGSKCISEMGHG